MLKPEATKTDSLETLHQTIELIKDGYELQREKASEAMVFLCCGLDRNWSKDQIRWAPVCWFPMGYSLTTQVFRKIVESVHNQCHNAGIHIPCSSFDGQWHNLAVRDKDGKPLTMLQLQKDVWQDFCKLQKTDIIKWICSLNCTVMWWKSETGAICLTNGGVSLPNLTKRALRSRTDKKKAKTHESDEECNQNIPQSECIPEEIIRAQRDIIDDDQSEILEHMSLDPGTAYELQTSNIIDTVHAADVSSVKGDCKDDISENALEVLFSQTHQGKRDSGLTLIENDKDTNHYSLTLQDVESLLCSLKADKQANAKGIWDTRDYRYIITTGATAGKMNK